MGLVLQQLKQRLPIIHHRLNDEMDQLPPRAIMNQDSNSLASLCQAPYTRPYLGLVGYGGLQPPVVVSCGWESNSWAPTTATMSSISSRVLPMREKHCHPLGDFYPCVTSISSRVLPHRVGDATWWFLSWMKSLESQWPGASPGGTTTERQGNHGALMTINRS